MKLKLGDLHVEEDLGSLEKPAWEWFKPLGVLLFIFKQCLQFFYPVLGRHSGQLTVSPVLTYQVPAILELLSYISVSASKTKQAILVHYTLRGVGKVHIFPVSRVSVLNPSNFPLK